MNGPATQYHGAFAAANEQGFQEGLNALEYFASRAPDTIPEWFEHQEDPKPELEEPEVAPHIAPPLALWLEDPYEFDLENIIDDGPASRFDLTEADRPETKRLQAHYEAHWETVRRWEQSDKQNRYFQWRVFYARRLLLELEKG